MPFVATNKAARARAARPTDAFSTAIRAAMLTAAQEMRELWPLEYFERAIAHRNSFALTSDARWRSIEAKLSDALHAALLAQVRQAGNAELKRLATAPFLLKPRHTIIRPTAPVILHKDDAELDGGFDLNNPFALDFVRRETGELISGITERAREQIRAAIERGFVEGIPVQQTAQAIRATLGLDERLARAVENQINQMSGQGVSADLIADSASAYADRLLDYRSVLIARTETMTASNMGTLASWRQASGDGLLPGGMMKQWIHASGSSRTCEICDELGESDPVPMLSQFYSSILDESFEAPPAHGNCRCTMGLVAPDSPAAE